jgi:ElaB/YqjD/DUF883 family membrane-anchored ribosome-binding protein
MTNTVEALSTKLTETYNPDLFLGRLCWYSIPDSVNITRDAFVAKLDECGVPFGKTIPEIRAVDVFKRGCTSAETNKYLPDDTERAALDLPDVSYINYMFRNSGQDKDKVYRSLIREVVDAAGHKLAYTEIATLTYDRTTQAIVTTVNSTPFLDVERAVIRKVTDYFAHEGKRITPYSIREFVRKGLEWDIHAIKVRPSGGIYFTQEDFSVVVTALETAINDIGGSFHTLPLLDDSKQRLMLKKAFEDESLDDINAMLAEITEVFKSGKQISEDRYADFRLRYNALSKKVVEYSNVLDEAMETTASYLEIADAQIEALWDKVKVTTQL